MICHRIPEIETICGILEKLPVDQINRAVGNVARFKKKLTSPDKFSENAFRNIDNEIWDLRVSALGEESCRPDDFRQCSTLACGDVLIWRALAAFRARPNEAPRAG